MSGEKEGSWLVCFFLYPGATLPIPLSKFQSLFMLVNLYQRHPNFISSSEYKLALRAPAQDYFFCPCLIPYLDIMPSTPYTHFM